MNSDLLTGEAVHCQFSVVTWCIIMLDIVVRGQLHFGQKGSHISQATILMSHKLWHSNCDLYWAPTVRVSLLLYAPHHCTTTARLLKCWHKAGWVDEVMLLMPNSDSTICKPQQKSRFFWEQIAFFPMFNLVVSANPFPLQPQISVLNWLVKLEVTHCYCSPSASRFDMLCFSFSFLSWKEWLSELPQPFWQLQPILTVLFWLLWSAVCFHL